MHESMYLSLKMLIFEVWRKSTTTRCLRCNETTLWWQWFMNYEFLAIMIFSPSLDIRIQFLYLQ
jgi:hypothetical protein